MTLEMVQRIIGAVLFFGSLFGGFAVLYDASPAWWTIPSAITFVIIGYIGAVMALGGWD